MLLPLAFQRLLTPTDARKHSSISVNFRDKLLNLLNLLLRSLCFSSSLLLTHNRTIRRRMSTAASQLWRLSQPLEKPLAHHREILPQGNIQLRLIVGTEAIENFGGNVQLYPN